MNLQDFVRDSLIQICQGVNEARSKNPLIAPPHSHRTPESKASYPVEFDVAVTVSEKTRGSGAGIAVASVIKADKGKQADASTVSRLRFEVPVIYTRNPEVRLK